MIKNLNSLDINKKEGARLKAAEIKYFYLHPLCLHHHQTPSKQQKVLSLQATRVTKTKRISELIT